MSEANVLLGAPRIVGEPAKLVIDVSPTAFLQSLPFLLPRKNELQRT